MDPLCPVCESRECSLKFKGLKDVNFKTANGRYDLFSCHSCGALFIWPRLSKKELEDAYPESYGPRQLKRRKIRPGQKNPQSIYLKILKERFGEEKFSLVDIGCGGGNFLYSVKELFPNAELTGVDISKTAIEDVKAMGIEGVISSAVDFKSKEKYDVVVCSQLLEHLSEPKKMVNVFDSISKKGTIFLVDVPAADGYCAQKYGTNWVHLDVPRHQVLFSKRSLSILFSDFKTLSLDYCGSPAAILSSRKLRDKGSLGKSRGIEAFGNKIFKKAASKLSVDRCFSDKIMWYGIK